MSTNAIRVRHPKGVSTIQVDLENHSVQDLQQLIRSVSDILPSRQILKSGYPPQPLTLIPELPVSSLGLKSGDQVIVAENSSGTPAASQEVPKTRESGFSSRQSSQSAIRDPPRPPTVQPSAGPDAVAVDGGFLIHRIVPDDNSCLFSSVALIFKQDITKAAEMRKVVAEGIQKDPETYNEGILGMPPAQYVSTILKPSTWGGAIELGILAGHFGAEIASIDVETGRIDHFAPGEAVNNGMRCIVVYSGIHYDAASLSPVADAPGEWHQTLFPIKSADDRLDPILVAASKLATILRSKKAYTNTSTFDLKCEVCGQGLKGEKGARAHAAETGHVKFGEY